MATSLQALTYTIRKGDTLYGLSRTYGVSVNELTKANPSLKAGALQIGQKIEIPQKGGKSTASTSTTPTPVTVTPSTNQSATPPTKPTFYVVQKGDTLKDIAKRFGASVGELRSWNDLGGRKSIYTGQKLRVVENVRTSAPANAGGSSKPGATVPLPPPPTTISAARGTDQTPPPPLRNSDDDDAGKYLFVSKVKNKIDTPRISHIWKYIVVHHSGSTRGNAKIFDYYHRSRGMENGLAYHFVIGNGTDSGDGEIEVGGRWYKQLKGGHLRSPEQNEVAIGICLVGDFNRDRPTRKQIAALIELINYLNRRVTNAGYPRTKFVVHRDINIRPTDCPGKNFPAQAFYKMFGAWRGE